jgi:hypothetical protein
MHRGVLQKLSQKAIGVKPLLLFGLLFFPELMAVLAWI